jgi:hypothetical protein
MVQDSLWVVLIAFDTAVPASTGQPDKAMGGEGLGSFGNFPHCWTPTTADIKNRNHYIAQCALEE